MDEKWRKSNTQGWWLIHKYFCSTTHWCSFTDPSCSAFPRNLASPQVSEIVLSCWFFISHSCDSALSLSLNENCEKFSLAQHVLEISTWITYRSLNILCYPKGTCHLHIYLSSSVLVIAPHCPVWEAQHHTDLPHLSYTISDQSPSLGLFTSKNLSNSLLFLHLCVSAAVKWSRSVVSNSLRPRGL